MKRFLKSFLVALSLIFSFNAFASEDVELTSKNSVSLMGPVTGQSVGDIINFLLTSPEKEVYLYINSPGGSVFAGIQLANVLKTTDKEVTCIANIAASMAFYILQSCEHRLVTDDAIVMQHVPSYGVEGQEPNNYTYAAFIHKMSVVMDKVQAKRMGMSYDAFYAKVRDDWWLYGDEAVSARAADDTASVTCSSELSKSVVTKSFQILFWTIDLDYSGCPLSTAPLKQQKKQKGGTDVDAHNELRKFYKNLDVLSVIDDRMADRRKQLSWWK